MQSHRDGHDEKTGEDGLYERFAQVRCCMSDDDNYRFRIHVTGISTRRIDDKSHETRY